jgi:hypothetical protein
MDLFGGHCGSFGQPLGDSSSARSQEATKRHDSHNGFQDAGDVIDTKTNEHCISLAQAEFTPKEF